MSSGAETLSQEARDALRKETRVAFVRSMAIAFGFAAPFSIMSAVVFKFPLVLVWPAFGIPMGLSMPLLHIHVLDRLRHRSFLVTILRQSLVYAVTIYISLTLSLGVVVVTNQSHKWFSLDPFGAFLQMATHVGFLAGIFGAMLLVVPVRFLFALSQKLGPGVLGKWIRGYYHEPREEDRIFMFLDMKDSTTLAEKLGNLAFSALVRDFFQDLTLPVMQTKAEVSHYIGDEAVITWTMTNGVAKANCVRIFFEFEKSIQRRAPYYLHRYGLVPEFKAGVHYGKVVATGVGEVKSEIVFHGDVLNTAARIQGLCNETGERLLLSEELFSILSSAEGLEARRLGEFELKGKEEKVRVVAIGG